MKHRFILYLFATLLLAACTTILSSTPTTQTIPPISTSTLIITPPTPPPKPPYLRLVWPEGKIIKEIYDESLSSNMPMGRGVVVEIRDRGDLGIADELREIGSQGQRVALYINNQQVNNDLMYIADGLMDDGPFWLSWAPGLEPGLHEARFQIITHLGEMLEYSWQFIIEE
jgi:hypothetical protein